MFDVQIFLFSDNHLARVFPFNMDVGTVVLHWQFKVVHRKGPFFALVVSH